MSTTFLTLLTASSLVTLFLKPVETFWSSSYWISLQHLPSLFWSTYFYQFLVHSPDLFLWLFFVSFLTGASLGLVLNLLFFLFTLPFWDLSHVHGYIYYLNLLIRYKFISKAAISLYSNLMYPPAYLISPLGGLMEISNWGNLKSKSCFLLSVPF